MSPRTALAATILGALWAAPLLAQPVVFGPDGAPTVVQRKLHVMTGLWEVGLAGELAMNTSLVDQYGGLISIGYHPNEWLDVGVDAIGNYARLSLLSRNIRATSEQRSAAQPKDEFTNDNQLRYGAFAAARIAPIYGKLNLFSEARVHFQAYALAGAGAVAVHRESVNLCADPGTSACARFQESDALRPAGELGAGFRFFLGRSWSLRAEARGFLFPSSYRAGSDPTRPETGVDRGYLAGVLMLLAGVSRTF